MLLLFFHKRFVWCKFIDHSNHEILILGRPIVKGGNNNNTSGNQFQYNAGNAEFQQHQHRTVPNVYGNPPRSKHTMATSLPPHHSVPQYNVAQNSIMNQRSNPINTQMKAQQVPSHLANMQQQPPHGTASMQQQQPPQRNVNATPMQLVVNQNYNTSRTGNDLNGEITRNKSVLLKRILKKPKVFDFLASINNSISERFPFNVDFQVFLLSQIKLRATVFRNRNYNKP